MVNLYAINTLRYNPELCNNCGMCSTVCPHGVFSPGGDAVELTDSEACMECGACQKNCPTGAITVESGVGCASAMIIAALTGRKEACCGPRDPCDSERSESQASVCCGSGDMEGSQPSQSQTSPCCGSSPNKD